jgi:hypothetical protein
MLIILSFNFLYHKLQLCFIFHVHYILFTCGKKNLKIQKFGTYFEFSKKSNFIKFEIVSVFLNMGNKLLSFQFFSYQFFFTNKILDMFFVKLSLF